MSAILASRAGDAALARDMIGRAVASPADPVVDLNAIILLDALGDRPGALEAARRLLSAQPDIGAVLADGPPALVSAVTEVRGEVAANALAAGAPDRAFQIALWAEDEQLARELLATLESTGASDAPTWRSRVEGWFGDPAARAEVDSAAKRQPTSDRLTWAWRIAAHACDRAAADTWAQAILIQNGALPSFGRRHRPGASLRWASPPGALSAVRLAVRIPRPAVCRRDLAVFVGPTALRLGRPELARLFLYMSLPDGLDDTIHLFDGHPRPDRASRSTPQRRPACGHAPIARDRRDSGMRLVALPPEPGDEGQTHHRDLLDRVADPSAARIDDDRDPVDPHRPEWQAEQDESAERDPP